MAEGRPPQDLVDDDAPGPEQFARYHDYVAVRLRYLKAQPKGFSVSREADHRGISRDTVRKVAKGERNLSVVMIPKFAQLLRLQGTDRAAFNALVRQGIAELKGDVAARARAAGRLRAIRAERNSRLLDSADDAAYYGQWYVKFVFELVPFVPAGAEAVTWLVARLRPRVSPAQVQDALQVLCELELIEPVEGQPGRFQRANRDVERASAQGPHFSQAVRQDTRRALGFVQDAIGLPVTERWVAQSALALDAAGYAEACRLLADLQQRLKALQLDPLEAHTGVQAYQLVFGAVPMTAPEESD